MNKTEYHTLQDIIPQIIESFTESIMDLYRELIYGIWNSENNKDKESKDDNSIMHFTELVIKTKNRTDQLGVNIVKAFMEELDYLIRENRERKRYWNIERRDKKSILTPLGNITYERTYYKKKERGKKGERKKKKKEKQGEKEGRRSNSNNYIYLLDRLLDIDVHQRIDDNLKIQLVNDAQYMSYEKSANTLLSPESLTRQTVLNAIRDIGEIEKEDMDRKMKRENNDEKGNNDNDKLKKKKIKYLYIEADEDHVSLQDGKNEMVKLVYIHEGIDEKDKINQRTKLKNIYYKVYTEESTSDIWEDVLDYIYRNYVYEDIEKIYIGGDGARWIREGIYWIPKSKFVLDKYHLNKYITKIGPRYKSYMERIKNVININNINNNNNNKIEIKNIKNKNNNKNNKDKTINKITDIDMGTKIDSIFKELFEKLRREKNTPNLKSQIRLIKGIQRYILNNLDGIKIYIEDENVIAPSAEGHVSHILSARLSSRPLGWSRKGVRLMAKLRVFTINNGNLREVVIERRKEKKRERENRYYREIDKILDIGLPINNGNNNKDGNNERYKYIKDKVRRTASNTCERLNNIPILSKGKITPIYNILKSIKNGREII